MIRAAARHSLQAVLFRWLEVSRGSRGIPRTAASGAARREAATLPLVITRELDLGLARAVAAGQGCREGRDAADTSAPEWREWRPAHSYTATLHYTSTLHLYTTPIHYTTTLHFTTTPR